VPLLPPSLGRLRPRLHNAIRDYYVHAREGWPVDAERLVQVFEESWTGEGFITREHELQRLERGRRRDPRLVCARAGCPIEPRGDRGRVPLQARAQLVVRGRFDRVDVRPEGPVIVDFKSSSVDDPKKAAQRAKDSLQLRIYALAWQETSTPAKRPAAVELHFIESGLVGRADVDDAALAKAEAANRHGRERHPRTRLRRKARLDDVPLLRLPDDLPVARRGPVRVSLPAHWLADGLRSRARGRPHPARGLTASPGAIDYKGGIDLVTEFDRRSERFVKDELARRFPGHGWLGEETGGASAGEEFRWVVDPLDGTTNFAHAYPFFCVSIALEQAGERVLGVVYDPLRDECFSAVKGEGAALNGVPIRVSRVDTLARALAATGFAYDVHEKPEETLRFFGPLLSKVQGIRRDGSAALNLAYLACGRFDVFWEVKLHAWDVAAGALLVEESGGTITDFAGGPMPPTASRSRARTACCTTACSTCSRGSRGSVHQLEIQRLRDRDVVRQVGDR
jgi:myo-inositol-1(or 4)-monophosphatase